MKNRIVRSLVLASLVAVSGAVSGCAGGLANTGANMGDIDGIVKAPLPLDEAPAYAKGDAVTLAKRATR